MFCFFGGGGACGFVFFDPSQTGKGGGGGYTMEQNPRLWEKKEMSLPYVYGLELRRTDQGLGLFTTVDVPKRMPITRYYGPLKQGPRALAGASKTHSLHVAGDMTVPVQRREYRVIDGEPIANEARAMFAFAGLGPAPLFPLNRPNRFHIAFRAGSLINSSRGSGRSANVRMGTGTPPAPKVTKREGQPIGTVIVYALRDIRAGEELLWDYPWKPTPTTRAPPAHSEEAPRRAPRRAQATRIT